MKKILIIAVFVFIAASCSGDTDKSVAGDRKEVFVKDNYRTTKNGELLVDDRDFQHAQKPVATSRAVSKEKPKPAADNSQISTMFDGFGNKTETRVFSNHPLLQRIVVRTSTNGHKKVFVYGNNGDVNGLAAGLHYRALTASANELAKSVGLLNGRDRESQPYFLQFLRPEPEEARLILPDLQSPVKTNSTEQKQTEEPVSSIRQTPLSAGQTPAIEKNHQAEINRILLQTERIKGR